MQGPFRGVTQVATSMGAATVGAHLSQVVWLSLGARTMGLSTFGAVLAAQALYAVLQSIVDVGPAQLGARRAARGDVDERVRGALTRTRLTIAVPAAAVALAFALIGHSDTALAVLPFAVALPLFALLNVWERYGMADGRPWAWYVFLRSAGPALAAGVCLALSVDFPPYLAGVVECAAILAVMAVYRLRPLHLARLAHRNQREPLRAVAEIGVIAILFQLTVASGTVLLSATGANSAAAIMGVGLRLTTGFNGLLGVLSQAIFPRLARTAGDGTETAREVWTTAIVIQAVTAAAAGAAAAGLLLAEPLLTLLADLSSDRGEVSLILVLAALPAAAGTVALTTVFVARAKERKLLRAYGGGAALTALMGAVSLVAQPGDPQWMAAAMLIGQLSIAAGLVPATRETLPELLPAARTMVLDAAIVAACAAGGAAGTGAVRVAAAMPVIALALLRGWAPARALVARLR